MSRLITLIDTLGELHKNADPEGKPDLCTTEEIPCLAQLTDHKITCETCILDTTRALPYVLGLLNE